MGLLAVVATLAGACAAPPAEDAGAAVDAVETIEGHALLTFPIPARGVHATAVPPEDLACSHRVEERTFDFPAGASDRAISTTAKGMCFVLDDRVFCHVSGTNTGFCHDRVNNVTNAVSGGETIDSTFLSRYLTEHGNLNAVVSGHSQGGYDASRVAPLLRKGDQLILLQPASASVQPNSALLDARARGVRVYVAWSPKDEASVGIRSLAGDVPLIELASYLDGNVHNAPNARYMFQLFLGVSAERTVNPALDASILSNPGSPRNDAWRFPEWAD